MKIDHIGLYVCGLEAAKDFFVKYFGALPNEGYHNPKTGFRSYFLTFDSGARLEIMTRPETAEIEDTPFAAGWAHLAFSVGSREAVDELTEKLRADGYVTESGPRITGDGCYESCVIGCEGNRIEITV